MAGRRLAVRAGGIVAERRRGLLDGVDRKLWRAGTTVTGGRLNALGALRALTRDSTPPPEEEPAPPPEQRTDEPAPAPQPSPQPEPSPAPGPAPAPEPAPEPAPAPGPLTPRDASAPFVRFSRVSPSRDLAAFVRRRTLRVSLRCNEPCVVRVELRRGTRVIARGRATLNNGVAAVVRLRLGAAERARLRRLRTVRLTVRARAVDPTGNARSVTRRVVLRR